MYQGMTETEKENFSLDLTQLEQAFCEAFDFDYNISDNWERIHLRKLVLAFVEDVWVG